MSLDKLHGNEIIALPSVIENKSVLVSGLQLEVDVDQVVGLHLGSTEVGVVRGERDRFVYGVLQVLELDIPCSFNKVSETQLSII